jgi:hypothetical protein
VSILNSGAFVPVVSFHAHASTLTAATRIAQWNWEPGKSGGNTHASYFFDYTVPTTGQLDVQVSFYGTGGTTSVECYTTALNGSPALTLEILK